jgi:hypothetical protein
MASPGLLGCMGVVMMTGKSLPDPVTDLSESQPKCLHLLPHGEVTYFLKILLPVLD